MAILVEYKGKERYFSVSRDGEVFTEVASQDGKKSRVVVGTVEKKYRSWSADSTEFEKIGARSSLRDVAVKDMLMRAERERRARAEEADWTPLPHGATNFPFRTSEEPLTSEERVHYVKQIAQCFDLSELNRQIYDHKSSNLTIDELTALLHTNRFGTSYDLVKDRLLTEIIRLRKTAE